MTFYSISIQSQPFCAIASEPEEKIRQAYFPKSNILNLLGEFTVNPFVRCREYPLIQFGDYVLKVTSMGQLAQPKNFYSIKKTDQSEITATEKNVDGILTSIFLELHPEYKTPVDKVRANPILKDENHSIKKAKRA